MTWCTAAESECVLGGEACVVIVVDVLVVLLPQLLLVALARRQALSAVHSSQPQVCNVPNLEKQKCSSGHHQSGDGRLAIERSETWSDFRNILDSLQPDLRRLLFRPGHAFLNRYYCTCTFREQKECHRNSMKDLLMSRSSGLQLFENFPYRQRVKARKTAVARATSRRRK